ncbi:MAG: mRNA surveillance protein pelota [archaeon]
MKVIKLDKRTGEVVAFPENLDDLWHLEKIIDKGDIVSGSTDRKIKGSKEGEKAQRQKIFVEIDVEDAHFQEFSENLKIGGIIVAGNPEEYVELKSHQSLDIKLGDKIKITKKSIKPWQIDRLRKAENESVSARLLIVLMDDESAELAFVSQFSYSKKANIKSGKSGKQYAEEKSNYFDKVFEKITALEPKKLLVAGPGFVKENFKKFIENKKIKGFPTIFVETVNSVGETGFRELVSTGKLETLQNQLQMSKESKLIEEYLMLVAKDKAEYGINAVREAITAGAAEKVILAETYLMQKREEAESMLDLADKAGCETSIISSKNPAERSIQNFGGIVCTLRYKYKG